MRIAQGRMRYVLFRGVQQLVLVIIILWQQLMMGVVYFRLPHPLL